MANCSMIFKFVCLIALVSIVAGAKRYADGDAVDLYANVVGPFSNPSETYRYFTLPLCTAHPKGHDKFLGIGEILAGHRLVPGPYELKFKDPVDSATLCTRHMTAEELDKLRTAIIKDYYFQYMLDGDLPVWGFLGKMTRQEPKQSIKESAKGQRKPVEVENAGKQANAGGSFDDVHRLLLFTHLHFDLMYNGDRVIQCDVSTISESAVDITESGDRTVEFTYSVAWKPTDIPFWRRKERYEQYSFLPQHLELHWFSIANSAATVVVLTGVLASILMRVLRADLARYMDTESGDKVLEAGWKTLNGDVFRPPQAASLFAACIGAGTQMLVIVMFIFLFALSGHYRPYNRGALLASCLFLYAVTAGIAGLVSGRLYKALSSRKGTDWAMNCLVVMLLFCGPLLVTFSILNSIAWAYGSTAALPFGTIAIIILIWAAGTAPLTIAGASLAQRGSVESIVPRRGSKHLRPIPKQPWYRGALFQMFTAGIVPFSAIYIELHYIFASVWGHKVYTIYAVLAVIFALLLLVTAFVTVVMVYFQLIAEDWRWWWRSFLCGGSTGFFVYVYAFHYFHVRSAMGGLMQIAFYFGYNFMICYAIFLMLGTVGWLAAFTFVRRIYSFVKSD